MKPQYLERNLGKEDYGPGILTLHGQNAFSPVLLLGLASIRVPGSRVVTLRSSVLRDEPQHRIKGVQGDRRDGPKFSESIGGILEFLCQH